MGVVSRLRQHPGKRKTGKQVTFSTDLIYDVLRKYEPDHVLLETTPFDPLHRTIGYLELGDGRFGTFEAAAPAPAD